jgi:hypothetical protein
MSSGALQGYGNESIESIESASLESLESWEVGYFLELISKPQKSPEKTWPEIGFRRISTRSKVINVVYRSPWAFVDKSKDGGFLKK